MPDHGVPASPPVRFLLRFVLVYVGIQLLPIDTEPVRRSDGPERFFRNLLTIGEGYTRYLFNLSTYAPRFVGDAERGGDSFLNWGIVAVLAGAGAVIWTWRSANTDTDQRVYACLRVAVRYRLALAVIAYGFLKLFAIQAPLPSLSNLNTAYGDHSAWKLFSLSLGIVPGYQSFLGAVELLGGLLLLNRKTTAVGTLILLPFLGNVFFSNVAYEGGEYVYSGLLLTFGLFLFGHDAVRLFRLVSLEVAAQPDRTGLNLTQRGKTVRLVLKGTFVALAVGLYGFTTATTGLSRFPQTPGLPGIAGVYRVSEFRQGGQTVPYSKTHPTRWQDVVFETWNTVSIRSNQPVTIHHVDTEKLPFTDAARDYELAGSQGRHYYRYTTDASGKRLTLTNANPNHAAETLQLTLKKARNGQITLSGVDQQRDSVYLVLTKVNKKYLLHEAAKAGRRGALTL
ncbi:MAG: DoxX family protein [Bacteroidetes bacterium]|nr:DoxX family protein [Fibrella sp.]